MCIRDRFYTVQHVNTDLSEACSSPHNAHDDGRGVFSVFFLFFERTAPLMARPRLTLPLSRFPSRLSASCLAADAQVMSVCQNGSCLYASLRFVRLSHQLPYDEFPFLVCLCGFCCCHQFLSDFSLSGTFYGFVFKRWNKARSIQISILVYHVSSCADNGTAEFCCSRNSILFTQLRE